MCKFQKDWMNNKKKVKIALGISKTLLSDFSVEGCGNRRGPYLRIYIRMKEALKKVLVE